MIEKRSVLQNMIKLPLKSKGCFKLSSSYQTLKNAKLIPQCKGSGIFELQILVSQ